MSSRIWNILGVGLVALFGAQALKAKQEMDDKEQGKSAELRTLAASLNRHLAYTRSLRIRGALTRPEMDPDGVPVHGWSKVVDSMPVLVGTPLEAMRRRCLHQEDWFKQYPASIFCGWELHEDRTIHGTVWRLTQTVFYQSAMVQG